MEEKKLTFSAISLYNRCPQAYKFRYIDGLVKPTEGEQKENALKLGSIVHEGLANHWLNKEILDGIVDDGSIEYKKAVQIIKRYHEFWGFEGNNGYSSVSIESQFETSHFKGQVDGIIEDVNTCEKMLLEHKTASIVGDNYWNKLNIDLQIRLYCYACNLNKVLYDVIIKPAIRLKKNETEEEFLQRYYDGLQFERRIIELDKDDLIEASEDALSVYDLVNKSQNFRKCRNNCLNGFTCDYFEICNKTKSIQDFETKAPNSELVVGFVNDDE